MTFTTVSNVSVKTKCFFMIVIYTINDGDRAFSLKAVYKALSFTLMSSINIEQDHALGH